MLLRSYQKETQIKILIADDKPENREYLSEVLKTVGFVVLEAVDGGDALKNLKLGRQIWS